MKNNYGFTLLELLATFGLIAILVSLAVPNMTAMLDSNQRRTEQQRILQAINMARSLAIAHNQFVTVCPSMDRKNCVSDWHSPLIIFIDRNLKATLDGDDKLLRVMKKTSKGTLKANLFPTARYMRFHPNGFSHNQNGSFNFCYKQQGWRIVINRAGRVRTENLSRC